MARQGRPEHYITILCWLSQFMHLIPAALRSQLEVIGIEVARIRAPVLHLDLVQDARGYIGNAVDYLTPREVRNVLVRQFQQVGQAAALARFRALRYQLNNVGGWFANDLLFTNGAEQAGVNYRDRYNQVFAWLHDVPWLDQLFGMDYNAMMPVSLPEQVDEQTAARQFRLIMLRARSAVQQHNDRCEAERKFRESAGGRSQGHDTQQKRKVGYGAVEQAAPVRQRLDNDDGTWVYGATSFESFVYQNRHHLHPAPNVPAVMPRPAQNVFKQHNRCFMCHRAHHPGVRCDAGGQQRSVADDVLQDLDLRAQGLAAVKRSQKKIAVERSAAASLRFQTDGPRDRNRGRGRGGGRAGHQTPAPAHQQPGTRGGRGGRGGTRGQSGGAKGGRGARPHTPGPPPPPPGP
jgi:hypothetical protein